MRALYRRYGIAADENASGAAVAEAHPAGGSAAIAPDVDGPHFGAAPPSDEQRTSPDVVVWKLRTDNSIEPVEVATGITDHAFTAVIRTVRGELRAGDQVITGALVSSVQSGSAPGVRAPAKK